MQEDLKRLAAFILLIGLAACGRDATAADSESVHPPTERSAASTPGERLLIETTGFAASSRKPRATPDPSPSTPGRGTITPEAANPGLRFVQNPLTGMPVSDAETLLRVPLLVSITEFPPSARPQAGLSAAAHVWETSIGEGMSRFLAVYYGDYLESLSGMLEEHPQDREEPAVLGPIRSGRIAFEEIKLFYPGALLITRFASPEVAKQLTNLVTVYARDPNDVNSAGLTLADLQALDIPTAEPSVYGHFTFDPSVPYGGAPGHSLDIIFNRLDQVRWDYDAQLRAYVRSQDRADGTSILHPSLDRLNGSQLMADNVVVLFAEHKYENLAGTILSIEMAFVPKRNGLLFRDGRMYEMHWSSRKLQLRLEDTDGRPLPLRPGTTYFEVVSYESTWDEDERLLRFHNPPLPTLTPRPTPTITQTPTPSVEAPDGVTPTP